MVVSVLATLVVTGCIDATRPTDPSFRSSALTPAATASGATRTAVAFSGYNDVDIPLSCLNGEVTHWEGSFTATIQTIVTPSGMTQEQIAVQFGPDYFVERANGVRYYPVGPFLINEHHLFGPVTVIAGTAAGSWRSADGDVLALGFHVSFVYDQQGNLVLEKWTGACP
jgi:hypothetical protein